MIVHHEIKNIRAVTEHGFIADWKGLRLMCTDLREADGKMWRHSSVSRLDRTLPSYDDLKQLKRLCIGDEKTALQVFPPKDKHVDLSPLIRREVLHLWCCLEGDVTPDFRHYDPITRQLEV